MKKKICAQISIEMTMNRVMSLPANLIYSHGADDQY